MLFQKYGFLFWSWNFLCSWFGLNSRIKSSHIWELSEDLPIIIEVVDKAEKIDEIIPVVEKMANEGLVTVEEVEIITYKAEK